MVGPSKQFDQEEALNQALQLFWEKGYEATSMQELVTAMGINRASMYQTYGNKYALYLASIERYIAQTLSFFHQALDESGPALASLRHLFEQVVEQSLQGEMSGCFINNTAVELGPHDAAMAKKIREAWDQFEAIFTRLIQRAIDAGEIKADAEAQQLAQLLNVNLQGLMVETKTNTSKAKLFASIDSLFKLIQK